MWVPDARAAEVPAPCREGDPDLWFSEYPDDLEAAKAHCRGCPVRALCLDRALARGEPWGVWGGQILVDGAVVATKRARGRPPRTATAAA